jgi:MFS family permease
VFGIFSASLFVGGLSATFIGRHMDKVDAATVMTAGSALSAATLALCAWSPSVAVFALAVVLLEISSGMVQYQAAFAAWWRANRKPPLGASPILRSTIFWPISTALTGNLSWREVYVVFAALNLLVCMPLHFWITRAGRIATKSETAMVRDVVVGALAPEMRRRGMIRGGSVCLNSSGRFAKWISASIMPPPSLVPAR